MAQVKSSSELKGMAREQLYGKYGSAIGAYVLMNLVISSISILVRSMLPGGTVGVVLESVVYILMLIISGVFTAGCTFIYLNVTCGNPINAPMIFYGFRNCREKAIRIQIYLIVRYILSAVPFAISLGLFVATNNPVFYVFIGLGCVILIAGIVYFYLKFLPAFYIIHDFPEFESAQCLELASEMMKGNMGRALYIYVSFIPLRLLALLSFGIASLWVEPYLQTTFADFYLDLAHNRQ